MLVLSPVVFFLFVLDSSVSQSPSNHDVCLDLVNIWAARCLHQAPIISCSLGVNGRFVAKKKVLAHVHTITVDMPRSRGRRNRLASNDSRAHGSISGNWFVFIVKRKRGVIRSRFWESEPWLRR